MSNGTPCWIDPEGECHPIGNKGHDEYAYDVLWKEKLGEHMSKSPRTDGIPGSKGKSGEVAAADAHKDMGGNPSDPRHSEELVSRGWTRAYDDGVEMVIRAIDMKVLGKSINRLASMISSRRTAVFSIGAKDSSVSVGLYGKELLSPIELVLDRLSESVLEKSSRVKGNLIFNNCGIRYFE